MSAIPVEIPTLLHGSNSCAFHGADPADAHVLGEAMAGKVALFVTGDATLFEFRAIENLEIASRRGFWEKMKKA